MTYVDSFQIRVTFEAQGEWTYARLLLKDGQELLSTRTLSTGNFERDCIEARNELVSTLQQMLDAVKASSWGHQ